MRAALPLAAAVVLAACGGGGETPRADTSQPNLDPTVVSVPAAQPARATVKLPERIDEGQTFASFFRPTPPAQQQWAVATSEDPAFTLEDRFARRDGAFDLSPVVGRGYEELKIVVTARRIGEASPPSAVRPVCREESSCEYALSKPYTIAVSDATLVKLVARGDGVSLVTRVLKLDAPASVDITFSQGTQVVARKRVTYRSDYWAGKAM